VKIFAPNRKTYYLKFSIDARYSNEFFISIAFIVFENYHNSLYKFFRGSKTIKESFQKSLNSGYDDEKKNNNLINNYQFQSFQGENIDAIKRSKSLNNSTLRFNKKANEILQQEKKYLYTDIKNIPGLTKSICTKILD
jgi:hypothetical protein